MSRRVPVAIACALMAIGSGSVAQDRRGEADWRKAATIADRARLRQWRAAWIEALATMKANGAGPTIAADPALFDPDRVLPDAGLPAGDYRCRALRLGMVGAGATRTMAWTPCAVATAAGVATLEIVGALRVSGRLYHDAGARLVFLGVLGFGDERRVMRYGRDGTRDMAGVVERVAVKRWRLVLPYPHFGGTMDLVEIVPRGD
ncbi:DUF4893 domain-containing protein [Sphingomonas sp. Tas61C01]|uniref:DUF4893 domain-containing protein n=1 Tax=Sphingomonas sp. Tas61C01 TaxID=3458297 RepID=UPI00403E60B3